MRVASSERSRVRVCPSLIISLLVVLLATTALARSAPDPSDARVFLGTWIFDMGYQVDSLNDIGGPTHFFSSRFQNYAGGRIVGHSGTKRGRRIWLGKFGGLAWTQSKFKLDWEVPDVMSLDPLKASLLSFAFPIGMELNLALGKVLHIAPYASVTWLYQNMKVTISDKDFHGSVSKLALTAGAEASVNLGKFLVTAGAGRVQVVGKDVDFDVDDVTFTGRYTSHSTEYFAGVTLR